MIVSRATTVFVLLIVVLGLGCASSQPVQGDRSRVDLPEMNVETTEELGNSIITSIVAVRLPAIELEESYSKEGFTVSGKSVFEIPKGKLVARTKQGNAIDYGPESGSILEDGKPMRENVRVRIKDSGEAHLIVGSTPIELPGFKYTHSETFEVSPDYFRQELIYNGKSGDVLRFLYREYAGLELRPAFTQEVSYDLAEGDVIGYKGSRFRVISATNTEIEYVPLQGFP